MSETEMIELCRKIYTNPDGYAEIVKFCEDFLQHEYIRLTKKYSHQVAAWRCNARVKELEAQYGVKLFVRFA